MDGLNPLDWTAEPFLLLYVVCAGCLLWLLQTWRNRLGTAAPAGSADGLNVLHLAYLSGGAERAAGGRPGRLAGSRSRGARP